MRQPGFPRKGSVLIVPREVMNLPFDTCEKRDTLDKGDLGRDRKINVPDSEVI